MSKKLEPFLVDDTSDEMINDIGRFIRFYSTALILQTLRSDGTEFIRMIGSGTFVSISNTFGILSAEHVVENLDKEKSLGRPYFLYLTVKDYNHSYRISSDYLEPIIIANGKIDSAGPDLGFIVLPNSELETIKASKNFYNLDKNRERILTRPHKFSEGLWAICGVPNEKTIDISEEKLSPHKRFLLFVGLGSINDMYTDNDYDYYDIKVKHNVSPIITQTFRGVSGGGLWQIPLKKSREGKIEPEEHILSGVVFYETERVGLDRSIKCHGRNSIYDKAYSFITEK